MSESRETRGGNRSEINKTHLYVGVFVASTAIHGAIRIAQPIREWRDERRRERESWQRFKQADDATAPARREFYERRRLQKQPSAFAMANRILRRMDVHDQQRQEWLEASRLGRLTPDQADLNNPDNPFSFYHSSPPDQSGLEVRHAHKKQENREE
jgi:hypothetical protein